MIIHAIFIRVNYIFQINEIFIFEYFIYRIKMGIYSSKTD